MGWLWAVFTVMAAAGQTMRNAMQKELTATLGTVGATHVRFLYGLPFGIIFLTIVLAANGVGVPHLSTNMLIWTAGAAMAQIGGTALLLAAMQQRSFVVTTAYTKTEPVQAALFGLVFLGERLSTPVVIAIIIATIGVLVMSWPRKSGEEVFDWVPAGLGIGSGALFAIAAVAFRGGVKAVEGANFVVAASTTLVVGLIIQTIVLSLYLFLFQREKLMALLAAWRQSLLAGFMGAFASQMWFLAFALESVAKVRTLALVEILFAQMLSRRLFKQSFASREGIGIALIVVGVIVLLNV